MNRTVLFAIVAGVLLIFSTGLSAQGDKEAALIFVGANAVAAGNMHLRESPPVQTAGWYSKGDKIGTLLMGEAVLIEGIETFPSLLGRQVWLEVRRLNAAADPKIGWVYYGGADYLKAMKDQPID